MSNMYENNEELAQATTELDLTEQGTEQGQGTEYTANGICDTEDSDIEDTMDSVESADDADSNTEATENEQDSESPENELQNPAANELQEPQEAVPAAPDSAPKEAPPKETKAKRAPKADRGKVMQDKREREVLKQEQMTETARGVAYWNGLQSSYHERRILNGMVAMVETHGEGAARFVSAVVLVGAIRVVIPFDEFFTKSPIDEKTVQGASDLLRRQLQFLKKVIGADIAFVVTSAERMGSGDSAEYIVTASRRMASLRQMHTSFALKKDGTRRINDGDMVRGTVLSAGRTAIYAQFGGADVYIPLRLLTYRFVRNVEELYFPGQEIKGIVREIKEDEQSKTLSVVVSAKDAEIPDYEKRVSVLSPNSMVLATVVSVVQNEGRQRQNLFIDSLGIPAVANRMRLTSDCLPQVGDQVSFAVHEHIGKGIVNGTIIRVTRKAAFNL